LAVIFAGSNGFYNYRHQADTCHAYQVFKQNGIPESNIIHLSYDDVAHSSQNPFPGQLFNKPTEAGTPGVDVYDGCKIHYKGQDVTAANVLKVLRGDTTAPGPVLKSTENSKVFFYFADHGAPGLIAMPVGPYLYADDLHKALLDMNKSKMYDEMTLYIEACESGSMFENILEDNLNIYAVSAANSHESSWGTYCAPDDKVNGKEIGSCLGDLFSVNWLEDADKAKMNAETLQNQFDTVQKETTKSHVLQWGQLTFTGEALAEWEGDGAKKVDWWKKLKYEGKKFLTEQLDTPEIERKNKFAVDSRDNKLHFLYNKYMRNSTDENAKALQEEIDHRMKTDQRFEEIFPHHMEGLKKGSLALP
jgi:legumain